MFTGSQRCIHERDRFTRPRSHGTPRRPRSGQVGEEGPQGPLERTEVDRSGPSGAWILVAGFPWGLDARDVKLAAAYGRSIIQDIDGHSS